MDNATAIPEAQDTLPGIEPPLQQYQLSTVTEFNATEIALAEFRQQYQDLVFNVATPAGLEEAKKARRFLVTCRTGLDKRRKELKADIIARGKLIDGEAGRITDQIEGLELPIDAQIKKREAEQEVIRQAKLQAEAQRQAAIHQKIEALRNHGGTVTTPLGELQRILARLQATDITQDEFEEHAPMAELTKQATIAQVKALIDERVKFDAEQAEAKRQQEEAKRAQEIERQANAIEQARLAEQQAQLDRERAEFAEARRKAAEEDESRTKLSLAIQAEEAQRAEAAEKARPGEMVHGIATNFVTTDGINFVAQTKDGLTPIVADDSDDLPWGGPAVTEPVNPLGNVIPAFQRIAPLNEAEQLVSDLVDVCMRSGLHDEPVVVKGYSFICALILDPNGLTPKAGGQ